MFISIKNLSSCKKLREKNPKQGLGPWGREEALKWLEKENVEAAMRSRNKVRNFEH